MILWWREQDVPSVQPRPVVPPAAVATRVAARRPPRLLHPRSRGRAESPPDLRALRERAAGLSAAQPADDGGIAAVRLRGGRSIVPQDRTEDLRGRGLPGELCGRAPRSHANQRVPQDPPEGHRIAVRAGAETLREVQAGEARPHRKKQEAELKEKVRKLLEAAEAADAEEDAAHGAGVRGDELPEELRRSKDRLAKIRAAKAALEAEAKANKEREDAVATKSDDDDTPDGPSALPTHKVPAYKDGRPKPKAQRNFTDPVSRIQKAGTNLVQGYNAQAAVDDKAQVIVAQALTNQPPDVEHLVPMIERVIESCGKAPAKASADAGYFSEENVAAVEKLGVDPYIATGRAKHGEHPPQVRGRPPANMTPKQRMTRKLATKKGAAVYKQRKAIVEPVFGYIKEGRGLRSFLLRGLDKARGEWSLICTTHNLLKLYAAGR